MADTQAFIVTKAAERPAELDSGKCFYCQRKVGERHAEDCVLIKKEVRIKLTLEYDVTVPASWGKETVEFHRNEGTWCADNLLDELTELTEHGFCLCGRAHFSYVKDRTKPSLEEE